MAKLTLTFKGRPIQAFQFDIGDKVSIGRNRDNGIPIDSLAVAPIHAEIDFSQEFSTISQKSSDFPLLVNNSTTTEQRLNHGDQISIGKHILYFTEDATLVNHSAVSADTDEDVDEFAFLDQELKQPTTSLEAQLQILNGKNIGRIINLKKGLTRLGKPDTGVAVIAKRKDGFYLSALDGTPMIKINDTLINEKSVKLSQGDMLDIEKTSMQFFATPLSNPSNSE